MVPLIVWPAAKPEAVAHVKAEMGLSEPRVWQITRSHPPTGRWCAIGPADRRRSNSGRSCVTSPTSFGASGIGSTVVEQRSGGRPN